MDGRPSSASEEELMRQEMESENELRTKEISTIRDKLMKGAVDMTCVQKIRPSKVVKLQHAFDLVTPTRVWVLVPDNKEDLDMWVGTLCRLLSPEKLDLGYMREYRPDLLDAHMQGGGAGGLFGASINSVTVSFQSHETVLDVLKRVFVKFSHQTGGRVLDDLGPEYCGLKARAFAEYMLPFPYGNDGDDLPEDHPLDVMLEEDDERESKDTSVGEDGGRDSAERGGGISMSLSPSSLSTVASSTTTTAAALAGGGATGGGGGGEAKERERERESSIRSLVGGGEGGSFTKKDTRKVSISSQHALSPGQRDRSSSSLTRDGSPRRRRPSGRRASRGPTASMRRSLIRCASTVASELSGRNLLRSGSVVESSSNNTSNTSSGTKVVVDMSKAPRLIDYDFVMANLRRNGRVNLSLVPAADLTALLAQLEDLNMVRSESLTHAGMATAMASTLRDLEQGPSDSFASVASTSLSAVSSAGSAGTPTGGGGAAGAAGAAGAGGSGNSGGVAKLDSLLASHIDAKVHSRNSSLETTTQSVLETTKPSMGTMGSTTTTTTTPTSGGGRGRQERAASEISFPPNRSPTGLHGVSPLAMQLGGGGGGGMMRSPLGMTGLGGLGHPSSSPVFLEGYV